MRNESVKVKCIAMDDEGKGIVKIKGKEIHVPNLIEGETALVEVNQNKSFIKAKVLQVIEPSKNRVKPECAYFNQCGGCQLQHISYEGQSEFKQKSAEKLLAKYQKVNKLTTMKEPYYYRNKAHSTVAQDQKGNIVSGIYEEKTHRVIPIERCMIQDDQADKIFASVRDLMKGFKLKPYDEDTGNGFLRHILVKTGFTSKQVMVVLIVASSMFPSNKAFVKELLARHPEITTIIMNVNNRKTSAVLGNQEKVLYGKGYIEDTLCGCVFQISSKSFYQINPKQTEVLYSKAVDMAQLNSNETILDAYCGIGTIALIASRKVKSVIGVELNMDAVKDAIKNAQRNDISNAYFYNEDAGRFMVELAKEKQRIDTVFMDPPRAGSDEKFLSSLVHLAPKKVVYISCNPITQDRDLGYLTRHGYKVKEIQLFDMFPQTYHVESVVLLVRDATKPSRGPSQARRQ